MVQQQAHYNDDTPNNFPDDYDEAKVDSRVKLRSKAIRGKHLGIDVRGALAQGIEIAGVIAGEAKSKVDVNDSRQTKVEEQQAEAVTRIEKAIAQGADKDEDLSEVKDARTDSDGNEFSTLHAHLESIENTNYTQQVAISGEVPKDIKDELLVFANSIPTNTMNILLLQDLHYAKRMTGNPDYSLAGPLSMNHIYATELLSDKLNAIVVNGDNIDGSEATGINLTRNRQVAAAVFAAQSDLPILATIGNHDDGSVRWTDTSQVLTLASLENVYGGKTYSYKDFDRYKIRVVVLSGFENPEKYIDGEANKYPRSNSSVFTATQLDWLANTALKIPSGYSVIIFNHAPFQGWYNNAPYQNVTNVNHDVLQNILMAFENGSKVALTGSNADWPVEISVDYTSQGAGSLIGCVFGHEHRDADTQSINGISGIERTCNIAVGDGRTVGDLSEYAFDVIQIDPSEKTATFNRFGEGTSAVMKYGGDSK